MYVARVRGVYLLELTRTNLRVVSQTESTYLAESNRSLIGRSPALHAGQAPKVFMSVE